MSDPGFDVNTAHKYFSVECFNRAWELLEKPDRSPEENEQMVRLSLASHWHWTQREDCTPGNISAAYWQTSRIYAVLDQAENARRYAEMCLTASQADDVGSFYLAYAFEAMARAAQLGGSYDEMKRYLREARQTADAIADEQARSWLLADLDTII